MLKSLFGLISNKGKFKSDKQAKYLLSQMNSGQYIKSQTLHFGEYDNRTKTNSHQIEWEFNCSEDGIESVYKITSKGKTEYWMNTEEYHTKADAKEALKISEMKDYISNGKAFSQEQINKLFEEYNILDTQKVKEALPSDQIAQLKDKYNTKINEEMLNYQQWAIDSKVKYYESL